MRRQRRILPSSAVVAALALLLGNAGLLGGPAWAAVQYTTQFALDECTFSSTGRGGNGRHRLPAECRNGESEELQKGANS
jgi:hypothetical protein